MLAKRTIFGVSLSTTLLVLSACGGTREPDVAEVPELTPVEEVETPAPQPVESTQIEAIANSEGQILVELPIGKADGLEPGSLLRVYDTSEDGYIKGMLQVLTVAEDHTAIARQIGLMDRQRPLAVGDPVRIIKDLKELDIPGSVERAAREEAQRQNNQRQNNLNEFDELRQQYRRELDSLNAAHAQEIGELGERHAAELASLKAENDRKTERLQAAHLTELSTIRETLAAEAVNTLRDEQKQREQELQRLTVGNARLQDQVDAIASQLAAANRRINGLVSEKNRKEASHERELRAELETREILENRIRELEVQLGLPGRRGGTVLVTDPERDETVLAQLERISRDRNNLLREVDRLKEELAAMSIGEAGGGEDPALSAAKVREANLSEDKSRLTARLGTLQEHLKALELKRLQAEQSWFQLAAKILRLPANTPSVRELQGRLREQLAENLPAEGTVNE